MLSPSPSISPSHIIYVGVQGLANMAMTACFAGPVFNMLVGVGVGFAMLLHDLPDDGEEEEGSNASNEHDEHASANTAAARLLSGSLRSLFDSSSFSSSSSSASTASDPLPSRALATSSDNGNPSYDVNVPAGIVVGFIFIIVNCAAIAAFGIFNRNFVPKSYGFVSLTMYALYLVTSFVLLFTT